MKIKQISVFLENEPGRLSKPCRALAQHGLNILTLSLADTQQYGILRLILKDWEKAGEILRQAGCVVNVTEVVAVEVEDKPGGLANLLEIIERGRLNIEYMYAFTVKRGARAVMLFRFANPDSALATLQTAGFNVLKNFEVFPD